MASARRSTRGFPHTGTAYGAFGLADSASGSASQAITIPGDARSTALSFWLNVTFEETTITTAYDRLFVELSAPRSRRLAVGRILQQNTASRPRAFAREFMKLRLGHGV